MRTHCKTIVRKRDTDFVLHITVTIRSMTRALPPRVLEYPGEDMVSWLDVPEFLLSLSILLDIVLQFVKDEGQKVYDVFICLVWSTKTFMEDECGCE